MLDLRGASTLSTWTVSFSPDPVSSMQRNGHHVSWSSIVSVSVNIADLFGDEENSYNIFCKGERNARVALADIVARTIAKHATSTAVQVENYSLRLETLDRVSSKSRRRKSNNSIKYPPYVLERSDIFTTQNELSLSVRIHVGPSNVTTESPTPTLSNGTKMLDEAILVPAVKSILEKMLLPVVRSRELLEHIACVHLQQRIRSSLREMKAVAFVADGSILPRKSGTSDLPMASPPALPFRAPPNSPMEQKLSIDMGALAQYLPTPYVLPGATTAILSGLVVPAGITLICGGGYHGKSTLLQTIALGVYDKIPGDGREYCVTVPDAVTVRAEDGRYVNECNISAFISNLPTLPGATKTVDTTHFSTRDSSGSTSQAANVSEAIEMGATAMLVDEDVSAANFMARDGRMRSLVMDESITPLLYRVNGLYQAHGISSVVVVGGVGDWLDVPHQVILLDKYVASDATKKAQSISHQFSHGHVQYAGRGVVHRLDWKKSGTPIPRRPVDSFAKRYISDAVISILDGGSTLSIHIDDDMYDDHHQGQPMMIQNGAVEDDDEGCIEASRLEQLLGKNQLFGCGLCVLWILQMAPKEPSLGLPGLLERLDKQLDEGGLPSIIRQITNSPPNNVAESKIVKHLLEEVGIAHRPRKFEVGQALTRMYGIQLEEIPVEEDQEELLAQQEAERKRQELLKIWANRRTKN